jgi:hypothetical protein
VSIGIKAKVANHDLALIGDVRGDPGDKTSLRGCRI